MRATSVAEAKLFLVELFGKNAEEIALSPVSLVSVCKKGHNSSASLIREHYLGRY